MRRARFDGQPVCRRCCRGLFELFRIVINQGTIILLGVVLWLVTLAISIVFVMRYAKKVKANKGSTICPCRNRKP